MASNCNGFNLSQGLLDSQGKMIAPHVGLINRATLGHHRPAPDAHRLPLELAAGRAVPAAAIAPSLKGSGRER